MIFSSERRMADTGGGQNYNETNESQKGKKEKQGRNSGEGTGQQSKEEKKKGKGMMNTDRGKQSDSNQALGAKDGNQYMEQVKIELIQTNEILKEEAGVKEERIVMFEKRLNEAASEKIRLEQQTEQLLQELHNEREDNKNLRGKINELENICECRRREISVQQAQTEHEEGIKKLNLTKSRDDLRDRVEGEKDSMTDFSDAVSGRMPDSSRTNLKNKNRTKKEASRETERRLKELKEKYADEIFIMQQKLTEVKKENAKLREEAQTPQGHHKDEMKTKELKEKLDRREKQLQKLRVECDELKTRLSKIISQRINNIYPDLTDSDLSDENRATKLAERYSELYDNQWTDAFREIQSLLALHQYNNETVEKNAISILLQALKEAMQFCECEIKEQDIHIKEALLRGSKMKMELPEAFVYQLKQTKKFLADKTVNVVCQNFLAHKPSIMDFPTDKIKTFVTECVIISWLMVNHDPPIALDVTAKPGDSFDSKKYKEYTKRGPKIDFLVWPPMQIKGHSLLIRGVVQCKHEYVENTERYPEDKTVASRLKVQTDASNHTADTRIHTPDDRTKVMTYKSEIKQAWNVAHEDTGDIQEYRRGYNEQDYTSDRLTSRIRPNDHIGSPVNRNDALTKAGRKRDVFDYTGGTYTSNTSAQPVKDRSTYTDLSEIPHSNNHFLHTNAYKNSRGGQYYADSTGVETCMRTMNYDLSSKGRDHAADTGVTLDQRYDETSSDRREYKDQYRYSSPSNADEYGYEGRTYTEVNDIVSQTIGIKHWENKAAYKQKVVSQTRQHPH